MEYFDVDTLIEHLKTIEEETKYWLVRTMSGDYYQQYLEENFIAIGYNEITIDDFEHLPQKDKLAKKALQEMLKNRRDHTKNLSYAASQLLHFYRDIRIGDIVIIPSASSQKVAFGRINSDMYEEAKNLHFTGRCPFSKRWGVKWLKRTTREQLSPNLLLLFNSRHIISEIDGYDDQPSAQTPHPYLEIPCPR